MEQILHKYLWQFVCVYIDNIIIFSCTKEEHLLYLEEILLMLKDSKILLSVQKCYFIYQSVTMLGHHIL